MFVTIWVGTITPKSDVSRERLWGRAPLTPAAPSAAAPPWPPVADRRSGAAHGDRVAEQEFRRGGDPGAAEQHLVEVRCRVPVAEPVRDAEQGAQFAAAAASPVPAGARRSVGSRRSTVSHRSGAVPVGRTHCRVRNAGEPLREAGNHHCQRAAVIRSRHPGLGGAGDPVGGAGDLGADGAPHLGGDLLAAVRRRGVDEHHREAGAVRVGRRRAAPPTGPPCGRTRVLMLPVISTAIRMPSGRTTVRSAHRFAVSPG